MPHLETKKTYNAFMQEIFHEFVNTHDVSSVNLDDLYDWARQNHMWEPSVQSIRTQFRQAMSRSLCDEKVTDFQGRRVRRNHAVRIAEGNKQRYLWADTEHALPDHMRLSLQQRRQRIVAMAIRHKNDTDSYNDNNAHGAQLQFDYDLNIDIEENQMPSEYQE